MFQRVVLSSLKIVLVTASVAGKIGQGFGDPGLSVDFLVGDSYILRRGSYLTLLR